MLRSFGNRRPQLSVLTEEGPTDFTGRGYAVNEAIMAVVKTESPDESPRSKDFQVDSPTSVSSCARTYTPSTKEEDRESTSPESQKSGGWIGEAWTPAEVSRRNRRERSNRMVL